MSGLLTGGIADIANKALGGIMLDVTVTRSLPTPTPEPWAPVSISSQIVNYKGFISSYSARMIDNDRILSNDRKVVVLAKSSSVANFIPLPEDSVSINGVTYKVVTVDTDPATATFTMQARM